MGQSANSNRNATLDQKKTRAAGRTTQRAMREVGEEMGAAPRGKAAGASGRGRGEGGGAPARAKDAAIGGRVRTGRFTRPARKGGT
jgi:hypothetical protein